MADYPLATIVLAAGGSSRMGRPKLFLPIRGKSLLHRAVGAAAALGGLTVVVAGAYPQEVAEHLAELDGDTRLVVNPDWAEGMAGSIAAGVRAADGYHHGAYLITLADQPDVDADVLRRLLEVYLNAPDRNRIIAVAYPEGPGVPAIFPVGYRAALLNQDGTGGARNLLRSGEFPVVSVTLAQPPVDLDTPEDYLAYTGKALPEQ